jgi:hypothetical protein
MLTIQQQSLLDNAMSAMKNVEEIFHLDDNFTNLKNSLERLRAVFISMRKVECTRIKFNDGKRETFIEFGFFHCWTVEDGNPCAIVETEDGSIILVYPEKLKFILE